MKRISFLLFSMITLGISTTSCEKDESLVVEDNKSTLVNNQTLSSDLDLSQLNLDEGGIKMVKSFLEQSTTPMRSFDYTLLDCIDENGGCAPQDVYVPLGPVSGYSKTLEDIRLELVKEGNTVSISKNLNLSKLFFHIENGQLPVKTIGFQIVK